MATDREQVLLWLNDRLGHVIEAQTLIVCSGQAESPQSVPLLRAWGVLQYSEPQEIRDAPYQLEGIYAIGDAAALRLNELIDRMSEVTWNKSQLGARLAPETSLLLRDMTRLEALTQSIADEHARNEEFEGDS